MLRLRKMLGNGSAVRLVIAFACGLLLGFLANKIGGEMQNVVPFLLFPLMIGIVSALTISAQNPRPYKMALGTGLLTWLGVGLYLLIMAVRAPASPLPICTTGNCTSSGVLTSLLIVYLLLGLALVVLATCVTSAIARYAYARKERSLESRLPH